MPARQIFFLEAEKAGKRVVILNGSKCIKKWYAKLGLYELMEGDNE